MKFIRKPWIFDQPTPQPMHRLQVDFVVHVKACALYSDETTQGSKLSFTSAEA
jgi:hypothetical protein